jgi:hypothetical protein
VRIPEDLARRAWQRQYDRASYRRGFEHRRNRLVKELESATGTGNTPHATNCATRSRTPCVV